MKSTFNSDPTARKGNRKVRNVVRATAAVAALALASCGTGHSEHKPSTTHAAPATAPAKPNISPKNDAEVALEQAREAQVEQVKLTAINAANKILNGLSRPGTEAKNYASDDPYIFGNASSYGRTKMPETFFRFYPDSNALVVEALGGKADDPNTPGNELSIDAAFKIDNPSLITSDGKLTINNIAATLGQPNNLELIGADTYTLPINSSTDNSANMTGSSLTIYGNKIYTTNHSFEAFESAFNPLIKPGEPGYDLRGAQISNVTQLNKVSSQLNDQLNAFGDTLSQGF